MFDVAASFKLLWQKGPTEVLAAWRGTSGSGKDRSSSSSSCTPLTRDVFQMGAITRIARCDATFNPWVGCLRVSTACDRCYAAALSWRYGWRDGKERDLWDVGADRKRTSAAYWRGPLRWSERAQAAGTRPRV